MNDLHISSCCYAFPSIPRLVESFSEIGFRFLLPTPRSGNIIIITLVSFESNLFYLPLIMTIDIDWEIFSSCIKLRKDGNFSTYGKIEMVVKQAAKTNKDKLKVQIFQPLSGAGHA